MTKPKIVSVVFHITDESKANEHLDYFFDSLAEKKNTSETHGYKVIGIAHKDLLADDMDDE